MIETKHPELSLKSQAELLGLSRSGLYYDKIGPYVEHITKYFIDYKTCYQKQYLQKKAIRSINQPPFDSIAIVEPVKGLIVVGGYSKAAKSSIIELKKQFPDIQTKQFEFTL